MTKKIFRSLSLALFSVAVAFAASASAFGAATIVIVNNDAAGVGFNDPTVVAPVGGNSGTTLGQQRLIAFQAAANTWGATLNSSVQINIRAQWTALTCTATTAVLGSAGAIQIFRDFAGAPFTGTWYNESMTGKFLAVDPDPVTPEINANFNVNLGQPGCLTGTFFYLGLDNNHGSNVDLVTVLTHEFAHGLGFQTFTNASTGAFNSGFPSIYDRFLVDDSTGKSWFNMTNAERVTSSLNTHKLAWNGPQVQADVPGVLAFGIPIVKVNSPPVIAGNYDAGTASYGPQPTAGGVTGNMLLANDGTAPTSDGCEAFPGGFFTGQIAVIDRGLCSFKTKTLNAQNAGATAVIIGNNVAGSPAPGLGEDATIVTPITIPTVSLTQADGLALEAQLGGGVNGAVQLDMTVRAGADPFGKALLFSPNPFQGGSSVSHWDTIAFPNQLMEPNINGDLTHNVTPPSDLTFSQLTDIGWVPTALPTAIAKTTGDNQNAALSQPFPVPISVTVSPAVSGITVTWTVNPNGGGAGANFPSTSSRFAVSTTNALGVATAPPLTANGTAGFYGMNATVPGAGTTTFNLSNDPVPLAGSVCLTDSTQADFQAGVTNNTDVTTSPGDVTLLNPANVDQQNQTLSTSGNAITTTGWSGQTFIPAVTGQLARADINLFCAGCTGTTPTVTVSVRNTAGGLPTGADLAAVTIPTSTSGAGGYFTFNFASPATLTSGTQYALVVRNATNPSIGTNAITRSATDVYASGARVTSGDSGGTWTPQVTDLGFITYMKTGNSPAGDFVSSLKDSNPPFNNTFWTTITWNATVPAGTTLRFQVAGSNNFGGPFNFVGPDGTPATFYTTSPGSLSQFFLSRYLKYKAYFTTTNGALTPTLNDVTICYNNPPTATSGIISGRITDPGGAAVSGVVVNLDGSQSRETITDANGNYLFGNVETNGFYTVTPALVNYHFGPENRSFSLLGNRTDAGFTATRDAVVTGNAIDTPEYFVRQHYLDFLGREPDESGFNFWNDQITSCGSDAACIERRTINVSAAYFLSIEFANTGRLVDALYRTSYDRAPDFAEFIPDTAAVAQGVIVGSTPNWPDVLLANKEAFVAAWVQRPAFQSAYGGLTNSAFVDTLISHSGGFNGDREALVNGL
ncbi:MAG TPA: PA domain-containing protein, partial [Pyrinomonadaceae bacterium]|nr:PA domain-containing protein [Pyrinomonadaceae bacterium]